MTKEELISNLQSWLAEIEFAPDSHRLDKLLNHFNGLKEDSRKTQLEAYLSEQGSVEDDFEYKQDEHDTRFAEQLSIYHDKRKKIEKSKRDAEENSYREKKSLIEELQSLIQDEENISKAYKRFNAIKQKWNELGPVITNKRREIQTEYSRLIEQFYYNIHIYQELQKNDLKKNLELKQEVINNIKALEDEKSISQLDFMIHKYLEEWDHIGPTFKEEWDKVREEFKETVNVIFEKLREHRKNVKEDHQVNFDKKQAILEKAAEIANTELSEVKQTQRLTKELIDLQKDWKHIGYAGRKHNDAIWKAFREHCDTYFEKRKKFIDSSSKELVDIKEKKRSLIDKAKSIYQGDEFESIANELKRLQREWKNSGKLLPQEEFRLFKEFRKYCDEFFKRKKEKENQVRVTLSENLKTKEELIINFTNELKEVKNKDEKVIERWKGEWAAVGDVSERNVEKIEKAFSILVSRAYNSLGITKSERADKEFESKLDIINSSANPENALMSEKTIVQKKIKEAESVLVQLEDKLGFFTYSKDNNPLKADLLKRIEVAQGEVAALVQKRKRIDLTLKEFRQLKATVTDDGNSGAES